MQTDAEPKEGEEDAHLGESTEKGDSEPASDAGNATTQDSSSISNGDDNAEDGGEMVDLKIIWNKIKYDLRIPLGSTGAKLKEKIHSLTGESNLRMDFSTTTNARN